MSTQTSQSGVHAALLLELGAGFETFTYNGAWHAFWDSDGIATGTWNERMLVWINNELGTSYANLARGMQALAEDQGFYNWDSMNTLSLSPGGSASVILLESGDGILLENGTDFILME